MAKSEKPKKEMTAQYTVAKSFDKFGAGIKIDLILHNSFIEFSSAGKASVSPRPARRSP